MTPPDSEPDASAPRYCSVCGATLPGPPPVRCTACGAQHWDDPKPCACALVAWDDQLLLVRRAIAPWEGRWDVPGGFCEPWEHPAATAIRETREEAGLQIEVVGFLGHWYAHYQAADGGAEKVTLAAYYNAVARDPEALRLGPESLEAAWFPATALPGEIAYPEQQVPALRAWRRALRDGTLRSPMPDWQPRGRAPTRRAQASPPASPRSGGRSG
jgi:8-oxo-dGTP diphosphatase